MKRWFLFGLSAILALVVGYFLFWPVRVDPVAWQSPPDPGFKGQFQSNRKLRGAQTIDVPGAGPEDVLFDERGRLIAGVDDGRVLRRNRKTKSFETLVNTGGRPLGLEFGPEGRLFVADARRGLLAYTPEGSLKQLVRGVNGTRLGFTNEVAVDSEGIVYFTDSTPKFSYGGDILAMIEHRPNGRLIRYNPETDRSRVILDDLVFANGVALNETESSLYVSDLGNYRILTVDLRQESFGDTSVFVDNLPAFPDNLYHGPDNLLWIALPTPRNYLLDRFSEYPFVRKMIARIPVMLRPPIPRHATVLAYTPEGKLVYNLQDSSGDVAYTTSAVLHNDHLYLGSHREPVIRRKALSGVLDR